MCLPSFRPHFAFLVTQVHDYNHLMNKLCREAGLHTFDTYALTQNATSMDGLHYRQSINVLKAQLLLNYVHELDGQGAWGKWALPGSPSNNSSSSRRRRVRRR